MRIDEVVNRVLERRGKVPENRSLLVGISGIDGSGKGYLAAQIEARLAQRAVTSAVINVDGWLNLPEKRFDRRAPAKHFYESAIRFDEFFSELVMPLRDRRSIYLVADFVEETAYEYRRHTYNIQNVDVILVEGIFLFRKSYRSLFDLRGLIFILDGPGASAATRPGRLAFRRDDRGVQDDLFSRAADSLRPGRSARLG